jgi:hypothetical protein
LKRENERSRQRANDMGRVDKSRGENMGKRAVGWLGTQAALLIQDHWCSIMRIIPRTLILHYRDING